MSSMRETPRWIPGRMDRFLPVLLLALLLVVVCWSDLLAHDGQLPDRVARGSLRPYWHVFTAYAVAWVLLFGWVVSIARRLARLEPGPKDTA